MLPLRIIENNKIDTNLDLSRWVRKYIRIGPLRVKVLRRG